ncbi:ATP-binding protein [Geodermatophilus maliterrae]|uniref:Adenylate/guanylate cyclase domain-containing protein n=1 Tax=Geodermatophilus maliterrae TaxID=3162531 RepID=A0ABV3XEY2_9ACTN
MADELTLVQPSRLEDVGLPTGTVTFVFTDIAGSTRILRKAGRNYADALADHHRLLRGAFSAHGGREVDTQGDAFFVAFPSAGQAVAAVAQAQQSLAAHRWPAGVCVRVRMGLHSGEATVAGESYVGLAVHRAARIAATASGGQVVLSEVTAALVGEQLPGGTSLRNLGEHRLKDFPRPAALYQLDVVGLPTRFPPLRTAAPRSRVPVPTGTLLGRDRDLSALASLLTAPEVRLITVTGPGGVGKTRLALEAAQAVTADFPGGAVFVPLSAVTDHRLVLPTLADALGARRERGIEISDAVRVALSDDRTLVVLDNAEQVVEAGGELAALLEAVPAVVALVTSRQVLRLRSERHYSVAPLAEMPAMALFAERAATVRPGFTLDAGNAATVAQICRRLDGLPLGIELAAARIRLLPPATLLARLCERLDVISGGPVDLPARQRTLRATMDWSLHLLSPHQEAVFTRLAVFSGGCTLAAAETVCGRSGEPAVLDALSALLDASLLVDSDETSGEPRLHMLETVRAFAVERLTASADRAETERRHTEWVLAMTSSGMTAGTRGFREALERLDRDRANIRAAVHRAIDAADVETVALLIRNAFPYLVLRDGVQEALVWLDQVLPRATEASAAGRARLLVLRAIVAGSFGDVAAVRPLMEESCRLLPKDHEDAYDRLGVAWAGLYAALADGSVDEASRRIEEAAAHGTALGQELPAHAAIALVFMALFRATLALLRGDLEGAEPHYRAAVELAGRLGDETLIGLVLGLRGLVQLARGDVVGGRRSITDAAAANRSGGTPWTMANCLEGLAGVALADGRPVEAARALAAAAAARRDVAMPSTPALRPLVDDLAARVREQLDAQSYEAACAEGRHLGLRQALDRALEELPVTDHHPDEPATDDTQTGSQRPG